MRIPLSWLSEYVDISSVSVTKLQEKLFSCGFEVEEVIEVNKCVNKIVTCKILEKSRHPEADKLFVCKVDAGQYGVLQIVTNAVNVQVGNIVPVAVHGAVLADGTTIKNGKLRGVESFGMFCGGEEIGITDEYYDGASGDSVLIFHDEFELGQEVCDLLDIKDTVFDVTITANRPDCQSILGIAREVAALLGQPLKMPSTDYAVTDINTQDKVDVKILDTELCPRYMAAYVSDIKIEPSPKWMQKRLALMGIRAINNVVDITNYVLNEIGQPMHAFDYRELSGGEIVVRRANEGEKIVTLDEKEFDLDDSVLVICDESKPSALAGIMGGLGSGIKEDTQNIVFESAKFKRDNIRKTSKRLNQRSDSSARFEKGVDAYTTELGMKRALALIDQLGAGKVSATIIDRNTVSLERKVVTTSLTKINALLGIVVPQETVVSILENLDFECTLDGDTLTVTVPLYRDDVEGYPDLAEEIIRMYGYDHIDCQVLKNAQVTFGGRNTFQTKEQRAKDYLRLAGANEIITYSFISPRDYEAFGIDTTGLNLIRLKNPLGEDVSIMRTTLLPSIFATVVRNVNKKNTQGRIFEIAKVYLADSVPLTELPTENLTLCTAFFGPDEDFFTLKGVLEGLFEDLGLSKPAKFEVCQKPFLHPTRSASISVDGVELGYIGQVNPLICEKQGIDKPVYVAEIDFTKLVSFANKEIFVKTFSKFPAVERDLALVCDRELTHAQILETILSARVKTLTQVKLFDVYTGEHIAPDKKSLAYRLTFSSNEKTFDVEEVENFVRKILIKLDAIGVKLR